MSLTLVPRDANRPLPGDGAPVNLVSWIESLSLLSQAVSDELSLEDFIGLAASIGAGLPGAYACAVQLVSKSGTHLEFKGHSGLSQDYISRVHAGRQISLEPGSAYFDSPSSQSYRLGATVCVDDIGSDQGYAPWKESARREGYSSITAIPLMGQDKPLGVLAIYSHERGVATAENLELYHVLANNIAWALRLANLRRREAQALKRLKRANQELLEQQRRLDEADLQHRGLMALVFEGAGIEAVGHWASESLSSPIGLSLDDGRCFGWPGPAGSDGGPALAGEAAAGLVEVLRGRIVADDPAVQTVETAEGGGPLAWAVPVFLDGMTVGHLWVLGQASAPNGVQRRLLERTALVASVDLWRERFEREIDWRLLGDILTEIIAGDPEHVERTRLRASQVGMDLDQEHVLVVLAPQLTAQDTEPLSAEPSMVIHPVVENAVRTRGYHALVSWRENALTIVMRRPEDVSRAELISHLEAMTAELSRALRGRPVKAVVSGPCREPADYQYAYRAITAALKLAESGVSRGNQFIDLSSLGVTALLLNASRTEDLLSFRDVTLGDIKRLDEHKGGQLLKTLRAYAEEGGSNQLAAQRLFLHPNTVLYRINKIEKLCKVDLRSTPVLLQMQLALMIDDLVEAP